jgi:signal peptidase I
MRRLLFLLFVGAGSAYLVREYAMERIVIMSASMEPTLPVGGKVWVNKFVYRAHKPRRGEIVMFPSPVDPQKGLVKRVIAVEGDEVELKQKSVVLNGQVLKEPYAAHRHPDAIYADDTLAVGRVPRGHVFVLGDNRDESKDSRDWKDGKGQPLFFIANADLTGRVNE